MYIDNEIPVWITEHKHASTSGQDEKSDVRSNNLDKAMKKISLNDRSLVLGQTGKRMRKTPTPPKRCVVNVRDATTRTEKNVRVGKVHTLGCPT